MANLETLELTINANAEGASKGLKTLINSLSALSEALVKPYSDLRDFNQELSKLKQNAKVKFNITGAVGGTSATRNIQTQTKAFKAQASVLKEYKKLNPLYFRSWMYGPKPLPTVTNMTGSRGGMLSDEELREKHPEWFVDYNSAEGRAKIAASNEVLRKRGNILPIASDLKTLKQFNESTNEALNNAKEASNFAKINADAFLKTGDAAKDASEKENKFWKNMKYIKDGLKETVPKLQLFHRIMRIAFTMLVRMGLRALFKGMKEGFNNYYQYAQKVGGSFAKEMDGVYSAWTKLKNQMGASLAPALSAAIPVLNAIASAATVAFNAISQLLALLSGKNSWSQATDQVNNYADAINSAGGGGSKLKEMLAQFDELNVIASESGGGGGGGGSVASDFENMFQEVYDFDERIRAIVNFIKENMESIKGIAIAIGTAILAWKLADAFAETLPLLSKLAALVGVGAVIAITLQVTWMLTNQYLNTGNEGWLIADMFTSAVGATTAAAIAQHFIGGSAGAYTASITLAFSALTGITALLNRTDIDALSEQSIKTTVVNALKMGAAGTILMLGLGVATGTAIAGGAAIAIATFGVAIGVKAFINYVNSDSLEWGSVTLTQQQVEEFVNKKMFRVNVDVTIQRINSTIESTAVDKTTLETALAELIGDLDIIKLGVDTLDTKDLKDDVDAVINAVGYYINDAKEAGKLTIELTPTLAGATEGEQAEWFKGYTSGWDFVDSWFQSKGEELGQLLVEEEQGVINSDSTKQKLIESITQQIADVTSAMTQARIDSAAYAGLAAGLGDLSQASANDVIKLFGEYKQNLTDEYTKLVNEQYVLQGELAQALLAIDPDSEIAKQAYDKWIEMGKRIPDAIADGVESASGAGNDLIKEWIAGLDFDVDMNTEEWRTLIDNFGGSLNAAVEEAVTAATGDPLVIEAAKMVGMTGWDLLTEEMKTNFIQALTLDDSTIAQLKQAGVSASEIFSLSDWDSFSTAEQLNYIKAISDAFGAEEALKAAQDAGINIATKLEDGLRHTDTEGVAKELIKDFGAEVKKGEVTLPDAKTPKDFFDKAKDKVKEKVKSIQEYMGKRTITLPDGTTPKKFFDNATSTVKDKVKNIQEYMGKRTITLQDAKTPSKFGESAKKTAEAVFDKIKNAISGDLETDAITTPDDLGATALSNVSAAMKKIKDTVTGTKANVQVGVESDGSSVKIKVTGSGGGNTLATVSAAMYKNGGFPDRGSLFVAGEAGPELVGTINGQTGVANQNQIVDGIRKGVYDAQSEQNGLLREQNTLLRAILAKDGNPRASAALGRIASQSIGMYNSLVGG